MENQKNKPPAFQFYANDFLADTAEWTAQEIGVYIRLLCYQWINGSLPNGVAMLARLANEPNFNSCWTTISSKFVSQAGRLVNKRLEKTRLEQQKFIEKQKEHGHLGAEKRWGSHSDPISKPNGIPNGEMIALQSSSSSSSSNNIKTLSPQAEIVSSWSALYYSETGKEFKADKKDFIIIAKLVKKYSHELVVDKIWLLFELCKNKSAWFTKGGMADFTIGKLSSQWNSIIEEVKENGKYGIV